MAGQNDYVNFKRRIANALTNQAVMDILYEYDSLGNPTQRVNTINKQIADLKDEKKKLQASMKAKDTQVPMRDIAGSRLIDLLIAEVGQ